MEGKDCGGGLLEERLLGGWGSRLEVGEKAAEKSLKVFQEDQTHPDGDDYSVGLPGEAG